MLGVLSALMLAAAPQEIAFERRQLSDKFFCEGATFADVDRDGHNDVISGPFWYKGPEFEESKAIYPPKPFNPLHYSNNFFVWPRDVDGDEWIDVVAVGFPGQPAMWFENPLGEAEKEQEAAEGEAEENEEEAGETKKPKKLPGFWTPHVIHTAVDNESPGYADVDGDGEPELYFHTAGVFGYAKPGEDPRAPWVPTPISERHENLGKFTHGLGVGDVNGDGRTDILWRAGWFEQPETIEGQPWKHHDVDFAAGRIGGAQMLVYDVDGDGDNDVITSLHAHGTGLSWFEQLVEGDERVFLEHRIMDAEPGQNARGVAIAELHALDLVDVDGDGLKDIVTGKRYWAHGPNAPGASDPADLYWFKLVRREDGQVDFVPNAIDHDSGVGTQVVAGDVDGDGRTDVVVGNKKGTFVFLQIDGGSLPTTPDGRPLNLDLETGDLSDWEVEGDAFEGQPVRGDTVNARERVAVRLAGDYWIGGYEIHGDGRTGTLTSAPFRVDKPWASFLVGGGREPGTRVELQRVGDRQPFYRTSGPNYEVMQRVAVDLSEHLGQLIVVRIVDEIDGGWGHVNFDDFRLHETQPTFPPDPRVPAIAPIDIVRHAGLSPDEAVEAMTLPEGFRVELVAAEPDLHQPIALAIGPKGRLWVAEAYSYPQRRPDDEARDRILVFEDADANGSFETRTVFASDLNLVSGLEVGFGGVWVGAAPYLLFVPDRDDDLVPDGPPEILLDGWGYQDTHETLNSFTWGPDGWLYGCHGVFTHSRVGKPGTPDEERVPINAGVWRFHPTRHEFEVFAWGTSNPWGLQFDDRGQAFVTACVIPHLYHMVQGGRYHRQAGNHFNPHVYGDIQTIADHLHYVGATPWDGNNRSNSAGGGHAHCGAMIYLGDRFPPKYRGSIFMGNIHGNRLNRDVLEPNGSGFIGSHAEDFLLSNDAWFRAISMKYGPDGSVFLIDWYDQRACHYTDPEKWDRGNGRMYRVSFGKPWPGSVDLHALSDRDLARLQLHRNDWFVQRARVVLQERGGSEKAVATLRKVLDNRRDDHSRLRALWALHAMGEPPDPEGLGDDSEYVRAWTVQLLLEEPERFTDELERRLAKLAVGERSPVVRLYLASALQRLPLERRRELARALALAGGEGDPNIPFVFWYGIEPLMDVDPEFVLSLGSMTDMDFVHRSIVRRAASAPESLEALVQAIAAETDRSHRSLMLEELAEELGGHRDLEAPPSWSSVYAQLSEGADKVDGARLKTISVAFGDVSIFPELRAMLADPSVALVDREYALDTLVSGEDEASVGVIHALLADPTMRGAAIRALASFDDGKTPTYVLAAYGTLAREEKRDALNTLASRPAWARALLTAVGDGTVPRDDLGAFVLRQLRNLGDEEVDALVASSWGAVRDTPEDKLARIEELKGRLNGDALAAADLQNGREVFARTCQQCHVLFGAGPADGGLGPELTGSNRADLDYILHNMVDPSAEVGLDYQATMVWLKDEQLVTGILREETDSALTLRTENDVVVVARSDVDEVRPSELSTMPDGLLDSLTSREIRDLVAYLASPAQVPRRATLANASELFDGTSLAGWHGDAAVWSVEDGEIVGRTEGLDRNAFLIGDLFLSDFRLTLEVKLVGDRGNSGIQFRSRAIADGDVEGYQADIGEGWWGKLYEEHGRALLAEEGAADHVKRNDWNEYEILAVGSRVRLTLNGHVSCDLDDPEGARGGVLALQVHSGGPTEVRFKNLRLELNPSEEKEQ